MKNCATPYWNEDHSAYAVLVSPGFGAGWSSWNDKELAYDSAIVEYYLAHYDNLEWKEQIDSYGDNEVKNAAIDFFKSEGYNFVYLGGLCDCMIEWVPSGKAWRIEEYDGAERIVYEEDYEWTCFK